MVSNYRYCIFAITYPVPSFPPLLRCDLAMYKIGESHIHSLRHGNDGQRVHLEAFPLMLAFPTQPGKTHRTQRKAMAPAIASVGTKRNTSDQFTSSPESRPPFHKQRVPVPPAV